jgi:hypothetical protein
LEGNKSEYIEEDCESSFFVRVPDQRKRKETAEKGVDEKELRRDVGVDMNSQKELRKQIDEVTEVLERALPVKVVLSPSNEENSRCKGVLHHK